MNRTNKPARQPPTLCVTMPELMASMHCGRHTAEETALKAGAKIKIGRRCLYNINKIQEYIDIVGETTRAADI